MIARPRPLASAMTACFVAGAVTMAGAQQRGRQAATPPAAAKAAASVQYQAACAVPIGKGVKTQRAFCEVIIAATGDDSMSMTIPAHTGPATLFFDLHPRYDVTDPTGEPGRQFQSHAAVVAIVGPTGDVIARRVATGEYRSTNDLFDRIGLEKPGEFKVVSPGPPAPIKVAIPAGVSAIGVVGLRLEMMNRYMTQGFTETGRAIALISSWRIEYTAR